MCKLWTISVLAVCKLCAISVETVFKFWLLELLSWLEQSTKLNQFTVQEYTNKYAVKVYKKRVYYTSVHKTSLLCKCKKGLNSDRHFNIFDKRNVRGKNITKGSHQNQKCDKWGGSESEFDSGRQNSVLGTHRQHT